MGEWALVIVTLGLFYATWQLAKHSKSLSRLTSELVRIENQREERVKHESRRREIIEAISFGEKFLNIDFSQFSVGVTTFCQAPHPGQPAVEWCGWIRELHRYKSYFINNDPEATNSIDFLLSVADDILIRKSDRTKDQSLEHHFKKFRDRLVVIVYAWRNELEKTPIE